MLSEGLSEAVGNSRVLVVGTGGIGCELLKNLVLTGFSDIALVSTECLPAILVDDDAATPSPLSHSCRLTWIRLR